MESEPLSINLDANYIDNQLPLASHSVIENQSFQDKVEIDEVTSIEIQKLQAIRTQKILEDNIRES